MPQARETANVDSGERPFTHFLPGERNVPPAQRIYTNRSLRMESIRAIGFDMDHTLALYHREPFEQLTFDLSVERLIDRHGYPESIRQIRYDKDAIIRGLVVDKRAGNLLKMDLHGYVVAALHGSRPLSRAERQQQYRNRRINLAADRYQSFDTLFSMPEGSLFAALVDLVSREADEALKKIPISRIFDDVRASVDSVRGDGSLKRLIVSDLGRYFVADETLRPTLVRFRALGKKLFLLTNSEQYYTESVLGQQLSTPDEDWKDLFDLILVESGKPRFFADGRPEEPVEFEGPVREEPYYFRGGQARLVERKLGVEADEVLYFGDHTYGDILRSKKTVGWRTAMIVHELEREIRIRERRRPLVRELNDIVARLRDLARDADELELVTGVMAHLLEDPEGGSIPEWVSGFGARELRDFCALGPEQRRAHYQKALETVRGMEFLVRQNESRAALLRQQIRVSYNPHWGALFREDRELSRFGRQVREFACIYTSSVANFLNYPGNHYFIASEERLPHE
jgi:HAD superfamily 5'-nucleotidase-like hydrolase